MKTSRLNANIKKSTIKRQFLEKMFASKKMQLIFVTLIGKLYFNV